MFKGCCKSIYRRPDNRSERIEEMTINDPRYLIGAPFLAVFPLLLVQGAAQTQSPVLTPIYSFSPGFSDGNYLDGLAVGKGGVLYGTTGSGGSYNAGTIFSVTPPASPGGAWTEAILYNFTGRSDGSSPDGSLAFDANGVLYGAASGGTTGYGLVFTLTPPAISGPSWTETVLYNFRGGSDGANPGGIVRDLRGVLYGITNAGDTGPCFFFPTGCGTVFSLTPPASPGGTWTEKVLHTFLGGNDGRGPSSPVVIGTGGILYSTTRAGGGLADSGTVFSLTPPTSLSAGWTETIIYSLSGGNLGNSPRIVIGPGGEIYGTSGGGYDHGVVFSLTPPSSPGGAWVPAVLYQFLGFPDGDNPSGLVVLSGPVICGATSSGGTSDYGTVFSLKPPALPSGSWAERVLASLTFADGITPNAGVVVGHHGVLYGTANGGGAFGYGTVFSLKP